MLAPDSSDSGVSSINLERGGFLVLIQRISERVPGPILYSSLGMICCGTTREGWVFGFGFGTGKGKGKGKRD